MDSVQRSGNNLAGVIYVILIGAQLHLWFLTALVFGATITAALLKWGRERWLLWVVAAVYLFGFISVLLSSIYPGSFFSLGAKFAPFYCSSLFFAIGWRLSSVRRALSLKPALALLSVGIVAGTIEVFVIGPHSGAVIVQSLVEETIGTGCVLLALSRPSLGAGTILPQARTLCARNLRLASFF